jgi:hypothetical protein
MRLGKEKKAKMRLGKVNEIGKRKRDWEIKRRRK